MCCLCFFASSSTQQAITTKGEEQRSNEEARNPKPLETTPAAAAPAAATALATTTTKTTAGRPRRPLVVPPLPRVLYHPLPNDTSSRPSAARRIATNDDNASVAIVDGKPQLTISKPPLTSRPPRAARCVTEGSSQQSHESQVIISACVYIHIYICRRSERGWGRRRGS